MFPMLHKDQVLTFSLPVGCFSKRAPLAHPHIDKVCLSHMGDLFGCVPYPPHTGDLLSWSGAPDKAGLERGSDIVAPRIHELVQVTETRLKVTGLTSRVL